jgi:hypothetical protein
MKKIIVLIAAVLCLSVVPYVFANTVTINMVGIEAGYNVGSFQFFFYSPNGTYQYPLAQNYDTFESDFTFAWNAGVQPAAASWELASYPITAVGNSDYATGYGAYSKNTTNTAFALNNGLVVTLSSAGYFFGINPSDPKNKLFDLLTSAQLQGLVIQEIWSNGNQTINVSAVPIPAAAWLLGSGLIGLVALKRRKRA